MVRRRSAFLAGLAVLTLALRRWRTGCLASPGAPAAACSRVTGGREVLSVMRAHGFMKALDVAFIVIKTASRHVAGKSIIYSGVKCRQKQPAWTQQPPGRFILCPVLAGFAFAAGLEE